MTLEQLRIFLVVADKLNMTRAAEKVHVSQPAVSAAIAALESRYATKLFDRIGRRLELTEAGKLLVPEARTILARVNDARRLLDELAGLDRGDIRIAASQTVANYWLPRRMTRFALAHPNINLHLDVGNTAQAAQHVADGEADIAFVEGRVDGAAIASSTVGGDRIALYAARGHPLTRRTLTRADISGAAWVMREKGSGTRDHLAAGLRSSRIAVDKLKVLLELPSNGAVLEALGGGELIAAVSELAASSWVGAGSIEPLQWDLPPRKFTQLLHRERQPSRAVEAFMGSLEL
jgi:DNA-binding transcriptional LysR family regulator